MENCLFIGNGLNRCLVDSISWGNLMEYVAKSIKVSSHIDIAMPMEFERMANEYMIKENTSSDNIYFLMKETICDKIGSVHLPQNAIHYSINSLPIDSIITTNYDYLLEYVYRLDYRCEIKSQKYIFGQTSEINKVKFYHPHGIVKWQQSLCLGFEHYMGIVQKLRAEINTKKDSKPDNMLIKRILFGDDEPQNTWGELFYKKNIAFVGFGLDSCESDIWWLLTHRAYIYHTNYQNIQEKLVNRIVYYDIVDVGEKSDCEAERKRKVAENAKRRNHIILKDAHVIVKPYEIKDSCEYESCYRKIFDDIKNNGIY